MMAAERWEEYRRDGIMDAWLSAFEAFLQTHIRNVQEAGHEVLVPAYLLQIHDASKWSEQEFSFYAQQFYGDRADPVGFARAWLHHQNCNPHHWEYWITRSDHSKGASGAGAVDGCLSMPEEYVREMVADWMGASKTYTGSWDMSGWLTKNLPRMQLHPDTLDLVRTVLVDDLGYRCRFDVFANRYDVSVIRASGGTVEDGG